MNDENSAQPLLFNKDLGWALGEVIALPAQRQSLFRDVFTKGNVVGQERGAHY